MKVTCDAQRDGIKREAIFNVNSTMRKQLITEVGDAAAILFWHLATRRFAKNTPITDDGLAKELGGVAAKWNGRKVAKHRVQLTKANWFHSEPINDYENQRKHINYYIGKTAVIKAKLGECDIPYSHKLALSKAVLKKLNIASAVEDAKGYLDEMSALQSQVMQHIYDGNSSATFPAIADNLK